MTTAEAFAAARDRIKSGMESSDLFVRWGRIPGSMFGSKRRPLTFAELRAAYASVIQSVKRIEEGQIYSRRRSLIIDESPACRALIASLRDLDNLPWGIRRADQAAQLESELEAIIAGRMAEMRVAA